MSEELNDGSVTLVIPEGYEKTTEKGLENALKKDCIVWEECSPEEKVMKKI